MCLVEFRLIFFVFAAFSIFFCTLYLSPCLSLSLFSICIPRRVFYMSKEFRASNSCIQVESVPLQSVPAKGAGRGCVGVAVCLKGS